MSGLVSIVKLFQLCVAQILRGPAPHGVSLWIERIKVGSPFTSCFTVFKKCLIVFVTESFFV